MSNPLRSRLIPRCSACVEKWIDTGFFHSRMIAQVQVRNAHRKSNASPIPNTIPVMLLQPVPKFGRAGAIVPVPVSYMRNKLYPKNLARYIGPREDKELQKKGTLIARDSEFTTEVAEREEQARLDKAVWDHPDNAGIRREHEARLAEEMAASEALAAAALEPDRSIALLDTFLPSTLDFERPMNMQKTSEDGRTAIYGSVSVEDVREMMRSCVGHNDEAARINFGEVTIEFKDLTAGEDKQRVKYIGSYQVQVSMRGVDEVVLRQIAVVPEAPRTAQSLRDAESRSELRQ